VAGAKDAAKKGSVSGDELEEHTAGAEAHIDLIDFMPGINPRPTARTSFPAARYSRPFLRISIFRRLIFWLSVESGM
jgi:hypothetical protein